MCVQHTSGPVASSVKRRSVRCVVTQGFKPRFEHVLTIFSFFHFLRTFAERSSVTEKSKKIQNPISHRGVAPSTRSRIDIKSEAMNTTYLFYPHIRCGKQEKYSLMCLECQLVCDHNRKVDQYKHSQGQCAAGLACKGFSGRSQRHYTMIRAIAINSNPSSVNDR